MKTHSLILLLLLFFIFSCKENDPDNPEIKPIPIKKELISGFVQKGPFIIGTSIIISELDSNLVQTGRTFSTQISSNTGNFEIKGIELNSPYVEIKADGFYFNEVQGMVSGERLVLNAIADLSHHDGVNVNILSTLEKNRLSYLLEQGMLFAEAKKKAQQEVLALFELEKAGIAESEQLNLAEPGEDNAILLASSVILQGTRSVAELSELLANIGFDIRTDGVLTNGALGSQLINDIKRMNLGKIRTNLGNRFNELNTSYDLPDFESKVSHFIEKTNYIYTYRVQYPDSGNHGKNILALSDGVKVSTARNYSLCASIPVGCKLKVVFTKTSSDPMGNLIRYGISEEIATWKETVINNLNKVEWTAKEGYADVDCKILLQGNGSGTFDLYEDGSPSPTKTIHISWGLTDDMKFIYPPTGQFGENLLAMANNSVLDKEKTYSITAQIPVLLLSRYMVYLERTQGTGTFETNTLSVIGWETTIIKNKPILGFSFLEGTVYGDAPVKFYGEGTCTLTIYLTEQPGNMMFKTFSWK
jgi:hypothetical protein